jgi:hypothetical protein
MPKPPLVKEDSQLEADLIETMIAGLHQWRNDLSYPESHSDMQACVRGILRLYDIKRSPLPKPLRIVCDDCDGLGAFIRLEKDCRHITDCKNCDRRGWIAM